MFTWFKKDKGIIYKNIIDKLKVDLHSHLIPAIDDGAKSFEESINYIKELKELGYEKLIITPHIVSRIYPNNKKDIIKKASYLKEELNRQKINMTIEVAAEYYLDEDFIGYLQDNPLIIKGKYLLFETSHIANPINIEYIIYKVFSQGYTPLFAHPERYSYIKNLEEEYGKLKQLGVFFQLDINSLNGFYGKDAKDRALFLVEKGWIDFVGSDLHNQRHLNNLKKVFLDKSLWQILFERNNILNSTL